MQKVLPVRQRGECCDVVITMPAEKAAQNVELLKALADPTRLQIVSALLRSEQAVCVCDLTAKFELSQPTISHHMARLSEAGLVKSEKRGIWMFYSLNPDLSASAMRVLKASTD